MANSLYTSAKVMMLTGGLNWTSDTIKAALVGGYTFDATDTTLDDVSTYVIDVAETLGTKSTTGGVATAADSAFGSVTTGSTISGVVIYKHVSGTATDNPLIAYIDQDSGGTMSYPTNGGTVTVNWNDSNGIIKL